MTEQLQVVHVGRGPASLYALETAGVLRDGKRVVLKAMGRRISQAVDAAEFARNRLFKEVAVESISIGTHEGNGRAVSTIEITLAPNSTQLYQPAIAETTPTHEAPKQPEKKTSEEPGSAPEKPRKPKRKGPEKTAKEMLKGKR